MPHVRTAAAALCAYRSAWAGLLRDPLSSLSFRRLDDAAYTLCRSASSRHNATPPTPWPRQRAVSPGPRPSTAGAGAGTGAPASADADAVPRPTARSAGSQASRPCPRTPPRAAGSGLMVVKGTFLGQRAE
ncbi:DUF5133 domain-containing protein [Streptomyces sp. NPDC001165]|uniref:DUF5133 domain-containing protein n=1 Tax=Streptomyces sp. NPDC001165 TaxID=3364546 RepID=UPI0036B86019